ncbi:DNA-3-methyladenine glycosylase 2 family protein [bacterium]|nr:DNA-3-methyladenine glycosylase 2 family protein [bacterium]
MRPQPLPATPRKAIAHLRSADPVMKKVIDRVGRFHLPRKPADLHALCTAVIGQSISMKAAESITRRFNETVGPREKLTPARLLRHSEEDLRAIGLSGTKASAMRGLAEVWKSERLTSERMAQLSDAALTDLLTQVRGIGPWTAKMFLIFSLARPDVMPQEDYGVRAGLRLAHGLPELPTQKETKQLTECWEPWRTVGTVYIWQFLLKAEGADLGEDNGWWGN